MSFARGRGQPRRGGEPVLPTRGRVGGGQNRRTGPARLRTTPVAGGEGDAEQRNKFGYLRLSKFLTLPPDKVILHIHDDLKDWKEFLRSPALKEDILVLTMGVIGDKVCAEDTLQQQQLNILNACVSSPEFTQKLVKVVTDMAVGSYPNWNARRHTGTSVVDSSAKAVLTNLLQFCKRLVKVMPVVTRDNGDMNVVIVMSITAAGKLEDVDLGQQFTVLKDNLEELNTAKRLREETVKRHRREGFNEEDKKQFDAWTPPDNIRDIAVIPTISELRGNVELFLRPNKTSGAYNDPEHYCDVQFRLFREDFVRPLRNGVKLFLDHKNDYLRKGRMPPGELRLYKDVRFLKVTKEHDTIVHKLQLSPQNYKRIRWTTSKRLIFGTLVILTTTKKSFEEGSTHLGVIFNRDLKEIEKGIITVTWEGRSPTYQEKDYLLFESEVYLEARKHTLETLKELELDTFSMKKFIVDANPDVEPPKYLTGAEDKPIRVTLANKQMRTFNPLKVAEWPTAGEFGLDKNQFAAFQAALTKEFAIIQGPPGTGKTFLGLKIAEVLLSPVNQPLWRFGTDEKGAQERYPITVVCYTNYALDQFLEGVMDACEKVGRDPKILRIGGMSKSEKLKEFTLSKVRFRKKFSQPKMIREAEFAAREKIGKLEERRAEGMDLVVGLKHLDGVVNFERITAWKKLTLQCPRKLGEEFRKLFWFGVNDNQIKRQGFREDVWIRKWFEVRNVSEEYRPRTGEEDDPHFEDNELYDADELVGERILDDILMEAATGEAKEVENSFWSTRYAYIYHLSVSGCGSQLQKLWRGIALEKQEATEGHRNVNTELVQDLTEKARIMETRRKILVKMFQLYRDNLLELPDVSDILAKYRADPNFSVKADQLKVRERWALFFAVAEEFRQEFAKKVAGMEADLTTAKKEQEGIQVLGDSFIAKECEVVGLTTTGAAKYNSLLRRIKSKIVIVEEAAQVFEAQVVTCLTRHCEHLIMIGDHQQLQPNPNVYELATRYNLNLSLFERMLKNGLHCYRLKVQHRMRPDISDLITGPIYDDLVNADSVSDPELYPDVKGVTKNVFFVTHKELEYCDNDSRSKSNVHEAKFLTGLCRYLVLQGYRPDQITVLTTYKGQMFNLRSAISDIPTCKDVRVSSVDDYQGQENDIVLVSLVRSNEEGNVGFVRIDNRICVTLSRAKQGLFVIGNMDAMVSRSDTWKQIKDKLDAKGFIGEQLELCCQTHGNTAQVKCGADFQQLAPEGGCAELCNTELPCSHICQRQCHALNKEPEEHQCQEPCLKKCDNKLHLCQGPCFEVPCPACQANVEKTLKCEKQHKKWVPCHRNVDQVFCDEIVEKVLICGVHTTELACSQSVENYKCQEMVTRRMLPCEHPKRMKCHEDPTSKTCKVLETKAIPVCEHLQEEECWRWRTPENVACRFPVPKKGEFCDHEALVKCCDKDKPTTCKEICEIGLPCGHACVKTCHGDEDPDHLTVKCTKPCGRKCDQGHKCKSSHDCYKQCPPCKLSITEACEKCGQEMKMECHQFTNKTYKCLKTCEKILLGQLCGHKCQNRCFETCGPCKVLVKKRGPCGHGQEVKCSEPAYKENCLELVKPAKVPICGHQDILFPCKFDQASSELLAKHCTAPCNHVLTSGDPTGCTHHCSGSCKDCFLGRIHVKCQQNCGRSLVCGHRCDVPCSKACPPCQKPNQMKCPHSKWKRKKCGEIIPDCKEPCKWKCEHKRCSNLCGEMCDREPCDEPCPKKLKCGHDCIGFCGEPCPPHCRKCDRELLEEELVILAVEEDIETARFVFLEDCLPNGHSIEVNALEKWMNTSKVRDNDGRQEIGMKTCPIHSNPIFNCRRFGNVIRRNYKDVNEVKKQAYGNLKISDNLRNQWIQRFKNREFSDEMTAVFPELYQAIWKLLVQEATSGKGKVIQEAREIDEYSMKSLDFITNSVVNAAEDLLKLGKDNKLADDQNKDVVRSYGKMFLWMLNRHPLSFQEMRDFNEELDRTDLFKQLMIRRSIPTCHSDNQAAYPTFWIADKLLGSALPLTPSRKAIFMDLLKELDDHLKSGLGITERERQQIVQAMQMGRGHWFKCPNGHIYAIGDCGGANQRSTCNICKMPIGGMSHSLEQGNQLAAEMDGAAAPAWPTMLMRN